MSQRSGFAFVPLIIALAVIAVVGGYLAFVPREESITAPSDEIANWQTYRNEQYGLEFQYSNDWIAETYFYGNPVMQAEGKTENLGFKVYKKDGEGRTVGLIVWGGPQSAGDTCDSMRSRGFALPACADIGLEIEKKGMYIEIDNADAKKVFDQILSTLKFTPASSQVRPRIVDHFACSDYCPRPAEEYTIKVYEGVTNEATCKNLGGIIYTYYGWGKFTVCEAK